MFDENYSWDPSRKAFKSREMNIRVLKRRGCITHGVALCN